MSGILIYSASEAKRNEFSVQKYKQNLDIKLVISEDGLPKEKPDFVINRTNDYKIAKHYEDMGVRCFNPSSLSYIANNKKRAYKLMEQNSIPFLPINYKGYPAVIKPVDGKGGEGVKLIHHEEIIPSNFLVQKPASTIGKDLRVYVIGNDIKFCALRESKNDLRSNFCLGGKASQYVLNNKEALLVNKIISIINSDFVGIDFLFDNDELVFNEIEDSVGARMVYALSNYDIIDDYCNYIKKEIDK